MKRISVLFLLIGLVSLTLSHSLFAQEVTIRYANWLTVDEEETERAVLKEFAKQNPDIKIDFQPMPLVLMLKLRVIKWMQPGV